MQGDKTVPNEGVGKTGTMDLQTPTYKLIQLHIAAKVIAEKQAAKAKTSNVFTRHFSY